MTHHLWADKTERCRPGMSVHHQTDGPIRPSLISNSTIERPQMPLKKDKTVSESEKVDGRNRIVNSLKAFRQAVQDYRQQFAEWPDFIMDKHAPMLPADALLNVQVYPNRRLLMHDLPKKATVAELGTEHGNWAYQVLKDNPPQEMHLFDLSFDLLREEVETHPAIRLHEGDSADNLCKMPNAYFDWIYIDGDHTYRGVSRDLAQAVKKVRDDGWLVFNDYTLWSWKGIMAYGVVAAVNELILSGWEMRAIGLNPTGYWEAAVQRKG